jgi:hypothetical protein
MSLRLRAAVGRRRRLAPPIRGGRWPRIASVAALGLGVGITALAACSDGSGDQVTQPQAVGMTNMTQPIYSDGQLTLYEVQVEVPFPVRKPTDAERMALGPAPKGTAYSHMPFLKADDESVEVHYVISNVDSVSHNVWLLIDPWNEFVRWKPGVTVVNDEETIPNEGYDQQFVVPAKSRIQGTITPDDIHEIAIKLASVQNFLASPEGMPPMDGGMMDNSLNPTQVCNNIFDYQNRSNSDPPDLFFTPWIPPVIAGLTGFDLGLRMESEATGGMGAAGNVAVEITMDVQDLNGNRMVPQDRTSDPKIGVPHRILSPPAARF